MHVVQVSPYLLPHHGGIEFVVDDLRRGLADAGHRVTVIGSDAHPGARPPEVVALPAWNGLEQRGVPWPLFAPAPLLRALRAALADADVVHVHGMLQASSLVAAAMARRRGVRVVLTEHTGRIRPRPVLLRGIEAVAAASIGRLCCRLADEISVLNSRVESEVRALAPGRPVRRVRNGLDPELFRPPAPERRAELRSRWGLTRPTALFVGRRVERKGFDLVAQAARGAFDLVGCGRGEGPAPEGVRWLGALEREQVVELYQAADLLVLPARGEGFPLVVPEAMACGLCVVVGDEVAFRDHLTPDVAAFCPLEPEAVRAVVGGLLLDEARRHALGRAGRAFALRHFEARAALETYMALYAPGARAAV
ncbi:MAG: glycosyltransferase family 4 protein [Vicinamibacteria bacterium]|nr:glycosyltransferase family 4 protein [Vicinamibacteria bacterium]